MSHGRLFDPARIDKLEDPDRRRWLPPADVVERLDPRPGHTVVDVGVGTGYFALPIAERIASGRVVGVDLQAPMLERLVQNLRATDEGSRVVPVRAAATALPLRLGTIDRLLYANLWHEFEDPGAVAREARRAARTGARLVVLDWRPDVTRPPGPPLDHRVAPERVRDDLERAGWSIEGHEEIGPYSYAISAEGA